MNNIAKGGIIVGGAVGGVLLGQWVYKEYFTIGANNSILNNAVGAVANTVAPRLSYCTVPNVMVGFPVRNASGELIDGPSSNERISYSISTNTSSIRSSIANPRNFNLETFKITLTHIFNSIRATSLDKIVKMSH